MKWNCTKVANATGGQMWATNAIDAIDAIDAGHLGVNPKCNTETKN